MKVGVTPFSLFSFFLFFSFCAGKSGLCLSHFFFFSFLYLFLRSQVRTAQMHTALTQNVQDYPGALQFTRLKCTRLKHRTCKTSQGHSLRSWFQKNCVLPGGILFFSKKVPATCWDFYFYFQKIPDFENSRWIFFHLNNILKFFGEIRRIISL